MKAATFKAEYEGNIYVVFIVTRKPKEVQIVENEEKETREVNTIEDATRIVEEFFKIKLNNGLNDFDKSELAVMSAKESEE